MEDDLLSISPASFPPSPTTGWGSGGSHLASLTPHLGVSPQIHSFIHSFPSSAHTKKPDPKTSLSHTRGAPQKNSWAEAGCKCRLCGDRGTPRGASWTPVPAPATRATGSQGPRPGAPQSSPGKVKLEGGAQKQPGGVPGGACGRCFVPPLSPVPRFLS